MRFGDILDAMDGAVTYYSGYVIGLNLLKTHYPSLDVCRIKYPPMDEPDDWYKPLFMSLSRYVENMLE